MLTAGVKNVEDLNDLFVKHTHTGRDFSQKLEVDHVFSHTLSGTSPATAGNYGVFLTIPFPLEIISVQEDHATAGTDGAAVALQIEKLTGTTAPGAGNAVLASALSLKATANTVQNGTLTSTKSNRQFRKGDRVSLLLSGTPTAVAGLNVTCWFKEI